MTCSPDPTARPRRSNAHSDTPPVTRTRPSGSRVAVCPKRASARVPAGLKDRSPGRTARHHPARSNRSRLPATTRTLPSAKRVAVWSFRAVSRRGGGAEGHGLWVPELDLIQDDAGRGVPTHDQDATVVRSNVAEWRRRRATSARGFERTGGRVPQLRGRCGLLPEPAPPITRTRPSSSNVAVCHERPSVKVPAGQDVWPHPVGGGGLGSSDAPATTAAPRATIRARVKTMRLASRNGRRADGDAGGDAHGRLLDGREPARQRPHPAGLGEDVVDGVVGSGDPCPRPRTGRRRSARSRRSSFMRDRSEPGRHRLRTRAHGCAHRFQATVEAGRCRPVGDVDDLGHLGDREVEVVVQDEHDALVDVQPVQLASEPVTVRDTDRRVRRPGRSPGRASRAARRGSGACALRATL